MTSKQAPNSFTAVILDFIIQVKPIHKLYPLQQVRKRARHFYRAVNFVCLKTHFATGRFLYFLNTNFSLYFNTFQTSSVFSALIILTLHWHYHIRLLPRPLWTLQRSACYWEMTACYVKSNPQEVCFIWNVSYTLSLDSDQFVYIFLFYILFLFLLSLGKTRLVSLRQFAPQC